MATNEPLPPSKNLYEKFVDGLKNNRVIVAFLVITAIIIGAGEVTKSIKEIKEFWTPEASRPKSKDLDTTSTTGKKAEKAHSDNFKPITLNFYGISNRVSKANIEDRKRIWDSCISLMSSGAVVDVPDKSGVVIIYKRAILDGYVACSKIMNLKSAYALDESDLSKIDLDNYFSSFVNDLDKESLKTNCFLKNNFSSNCNVGYGKEEDKTDAKYFSIIDFRLRLGELIYQNLTITKEVTYLPAEYADIFPPHTRSPELFSYLWIRFKNNLYTLISPKKFKEKGYDKIVEYLLETHDYIYARDYKTVFNTITEQKSKGEIFNEYMDIPRKNNIEMKGYWGNHFSNWFYSFWYRRYVERTDNISYQILKEIKLHYN